MPKTIKMPSQKDGIFVLSLSVMKKACAHIFSLVFLLCASVAMAQPPTADAGPYQKFCSAPASTTLGTTSTASGGIPPYTYAWAPSAPLNNSTIANPTATVTTTTIFTVTVTGSNGESAKDTVTISLYNYTINAGKDTTIRQGQTITLHGSAPGATHVNWMPSGYNIYNQNSLSPDVYPGVTVTYTFSAIYTPSGCTLVDYITVTVIPSSDLFFFNTFSPNGDGANDYFYIGNIEKYPDNVLEIYNRYGQKVFNKASYQNDWDGKYLNSELPSGTYFYILDTKNPTGGKHHGQVTIIR